MKDSAISSGHVSFGTALVRYIGILLALLRREEESRRAAPMDAILNLLEPVMLTGVTIGHMIGASK